LKSTRPIRFVLAPLLACVLIGPTASASLAGSVTTGPLVTLDSTQKIHPLLQYGAQADPTSIVRVIVQKTRADVQSSTIAATVPGMRVSENFQFTPAFVATVPQTGVPALALNASVRYVSPDAAVQVIPSVPQLPSKPAPRPPAPKPVAPPKTGFDAANLFTKFPLVSGATSAWSGAATPDGHRFSGVNIAVAVIDSGVDQNHPDVSGQVLAVNVNRNASGPADGYGHGTHVAAIINGHDADGQYYGIAPSVTVISVKIADDTGQAFESDLLRGLDWVRLNRDAYHIRAVNLSVSSGLASSYAVSPVDAAVERLWHDNVTVVAAAGNLGAATDATWYAPANDPFVITVGCLDDNQTVATSDDSLCPISSRGVTQDGFAKPDLIAPGRKIESALSAGIDGRGSILAGDFPDRITADGEHIRLSGTSMSAPMVTGAIALLLQRHGGLQPNQLKQLLVNSASDYPGQPDGAGALNIPAALVASDHAPSGDHYQPLPVGGTVPPSGSITLLWDGARWGNAYFDGARWGSAYFDGARWGSAEWDGARWGSASWNGARWGSAYWNGARWGGATWDDATSD
jgi:serine protease AprX